MKRRLLAGFALALLLTVTSAFAETTGIWKHDFEAASSEAKKLGKDLFVDFSGSDWCIWCVRLSNEVLLKPEFQEEAGKYFVLVELDYPRSKKQDPRIKSQNARLKAKYKIAGYPTVYLMDADGRPYARTGYKAGGPEAYLPHLTELRAIRVARDLAFDKAKKLSGFAKARALDEAIDGLAKAGVANFYVDEMREIQKLDRNGKAGLAKKYTKTLDGLDIEAAQASGQSNDALRLIKEYIKKYKPEGPELQQLLTKAGMVHYRSKDIDGAIERFLEARAAAPSHPFAQQLLKWVEQLKKAKEEMRQ